MESLFIFLGGVVFGSIIRWAWPEKRNSGNKHLINSLHFKLDNFMAKSQERFDLIIGRLNTITSDIAADYAKLLDAVKDTISEESFAAAEANIAVLEQLGASVENPVPEVPEP